MVNCKLCKEKTSDSNFIGESTDNEEIYICQVCQGKYGPKLNDKLESLGIVFEKDQETKPFTCHLEYSGGTKQDVAQMVCNIIDNEEIWDEVKQQMGWL